MTSKAHNRLFHTVAMAAIATVWTGLAHAADVAIRPASEEHAPVKVELIDSSRLGCGQGMALWNSGSGTQCAFDSATRGARVTAIHEFESGSLEAYATAARSSSGFWTPEQLLAPQGRRTSEDADFFLVGVTGSAFDKRLRLKAEMGWMDRVVARVRETDWHPAERTRQGSMASVRLDARLVDTAKFNWSLTAEYRSASEDYSIGRSAALFRHFAMPGTRLAFSSSAKAGPVHLTAGLDQFDGLLGKSLTRRAGIGVDGISLRLASREYQGEPLAGSTMIGSESHSDSAILDINRDLLAMTLLPAAGDLPFFVPATLSVSLKSGETESRYETGLQRYRSSSLGIDASWDTPAGETSFGYWRDRRTGLAEGSMDRSSETIQLSHSLRRGHWRFGLDASLSRMQGEGGSGYSDRSLSFGQSVAYSAPNGPELRLQLGQDRAAMRQLDDSYVASDSYSSVTASLDLSRYLQKRFERDDLRLTFDYRKAVDRSDSEMSFEDELIERWTDHDRREGFLLSFGMKL